MQLIFLGAAGEATGSCYLIESLNAATLAEVIQHQLKWNVSVRHNTQRLHF